MLLQHPATRLRRLLCCSTREPCAPPRGQDTSRHTRLSRSGGSSRDEAPGWRVRLTRPQLRPPSKNAPVLAWRRQPAPGRTQHLGAGHTDQTRPLAWGLLEWGVPSTAHRGVPPPPASARQPVSALPSQGPVITVLLPGPPLLLSRPSDPAGGRGAAHSLGLELSASPGWDSAAPRETNPAVPVLPCCTRK